MFSPSWYQTQQDISSVLLAILHKTLSQNCIDKHRETFGGMVIACIVQSHTPRRYRSRGNVDRVWKAFRHSCRVAYSPVDKKYETAFSITLCRPQWQLVQQGSLTPSYFKAVWNLTLANVCILSVPFVQKVLDTYTIYLLGVIHIGLVCDSLFYITDNF